MDFVTGKYGEGAKGHHLKKLGLEKSNPLSKKEKSELESFRNSSSKKKDMAKKISSKCSTCGKGHSNHANYVTRTGNVE